VSIPPDEPPAGDPAVPPLRAGLEGGSCPNCGTPYEPGQEYCLQCGVRLPIVRGIVPILRRTWQRRLPWYPGDWLWPVLLGLVIAALSALIAILATRDEGSSRQVLVGTQPTVAETGAGTVAAPPEQTGTLPTGTLPSTATEAAPTPPTTSGGLTEWPAGTSGYTIILRSLPTSAGRPVAVRDAKSASNAGVTDVGVLNSSDYSSLHPGYYVVFSGVYNTASEAKAALSSVRSSGYGEAYTRRIAQ
jgi:hypothetical protein